MGVDGAEPFIRFARLFGLGRMDVSRFFSFNYIHSVIYIQRCPVTVIISTAFSI